MSAMTPSDVSVLRYGCRTEDFHPMECDGPGGCRHCDRALMSTIECVITHDPGTCALCDPEYDLMPNPSWGVAWTP